jgi:hypothetical protein
MITKKMADRGFVTLKMLPVVFERGSTVIQKIRDPEHSL